MLSVMANIRHAPTLPSPLPNTICVDGPRIMTIPKEESEPHLAGCSAASRRDGDEESKAAAVCAPCLCAAVDLGNVAGVDL